MKRTLALIAPAVALVALPARADGFDCFPMCAEDAAVAASRAMAVQAPQPINLCENSTVREVAKIDNSLAPVKRLYSIATNPTGFAIQQVSDHIVHIPPWVNYVADPRGTIRAKLIEKVREQAKKQVGLQNSCVDEIKAETAGGELVAEPIDESAGLELPVIDI